jgi:hypothetical protein
MTIRSNVLLALLPVALGQSEAGAQSSTVCRDRDNAERTTSIYSEPGNAHFVVQTDSAGKLHLGQHGAGHVAIAIQTGQSGALAIDQAGASATADISQDGACNDVQLAQNGAGSTATVRQSGSGNHAVVRQGPRREN